MNIRTLLIVAIIGVSFASCDSFKDLAAVSVDTTLNVDVPLEATDDAASVNLKSTNAFGDFAGSAEIDLKTNKDVKDYVDGLRDITASSVLLNFGGLAADQKIESISIVAEIVGGDSETYTGSNLTATSIDTEMSSFLSLINGWDITENTVIKFTVNGKANFHVTRAVKAKISIPSKVKYSPL
jgi:hypothetical protein